MCFVNRVVYLIGPGRPDHLTSESHLLFIAGCNKQCPSIISGRWCPIVAHNGLRKTTCLRAVHMIEQLPRLCSTKLSSFFARNKLSSHTLKDWAQCPLEFLQRMGLGVGEGVSLQGVTV